MVMWRTPHGERVLQGAEWELFREGLDTLWDWVESSAADPDIANTGTKAFDRLQIGQKLALLASVGTALSDEGVPPLELTVNTESAVAAVFRQIANEVELEIDQSRDSEWLSNLDTPEEATHWRRLVLAAYREAMLQNEAEALAWSKGEDGPQQEGPADGENCLDDEGDSDRPWSPPDATSEVAEEWQFLVDDLANRILWDDGDYDAGDAFLDDDPAEARAMMKLMGIASGYYTDIAPDPAEEQLELIRRTLRSLCGRLAPG
jgi:hypothetical protein